MAPVNEIGLGIAMAIGIAVGLWPAEKADCDSDCDPDADTDCRLLRRALSLNEVSVGILVICLVIHLRSKY